MDRVERIELWLKVIADELYIARMNENKEANRPNSPWSSTTRQFMEEDIEKTRLRLETSG